MKYPLNQYKQLEQAIKELSKYIDVKRVQPLQLHTIIYSNKNSGQTHNKILLNPDTKELVKAFKFDSDICNDLGQVARDDKHLFIELFETDDNFLLNPNDCNDTHIITAVNKIVNSL